MMRVRFPSIATKISGGYRLNQTKLLDEKAIAVIEEILRSGKDVKIKKSNGKVVILEITAKRKI